MCIIVAAPVGAKVSKSILKNCWNNNKHGGGFMYSDGKRVRIVKELKSFKRYWRKLSAAKARFTKSGFVCHFRISTHGLINEENCHPFLVNQNLGFAHNGIIYTAPASKEYSDTYMFNEEILKHLPNSFLRNKAMVALITSYIGIGSKLAFLNDNGDITLVNEKAGVWDGGIWYSNSGYKSYNYFDFGGSKTSLVYGTATLPSISKAAKTVEQELPFPKLYQGEYDYSYNEQPVAPVCDYCGDYLATSSERINICCTTCFNQMLDKDRRDYSLRNTIY